MKTNSDRSLEEAALRQKGCVGPSAAGVASYLSWRKIAASLAEIPIKAVMTKVRAESEVSGVLISIYYRVAGAGGRSTGCNSIRSATDTPSHVETAGEVDTWSPNCLETILWIFSIFVVVEN